MLGKGDVVIVDNSTIGVVKFLAIWASKNQQFVDVLTNDGEHLKNVLIERIRIMTKAELSKLTAKELNAVLGGKYTDSQLRKIKKAKLVEEVMQKNAEDVQKLNKQKSKSAATVKTNTDLESLFEKDGRRIEPFTIVYSDGSRADVDLPSTIKQFKVAYGTHKIAFRPAKYWVKKLNPDISINGWKDIICHSMLEAEAESDADPAA